MKEMTRNLLVGVFVVLSLGALATLMVWFGETPSWLRTSEWELRICEVSQLAGIGDGSPVNLNGVEIGRVKRLEFANEDRPDHGVAIIAGIKTQYFIPRRATARVYGATLGFGSGHIEIVIEPGKVPVPLPKDGSATISGEMRSVVGEVISKEMIGSLERTISNIGDLTEQWAPVGANLALLIEQRSVDAVSQPDAEQLGITPNLATVVERLDRMVKHLNTVLGDEHVQEDVKAVVTDLRDSSTGLKQLVELWKNETESIAQNINGGIDRTEENLDSSFANLNQVLEQLDNTARSLAVVLQQVERGEGTAGLFVRDARLYEAAVLTLERASDVLLNLQVITGKIKEDGYIIVGKAPTGLLKGKFPVGTKAAKIE